MYSFDTLLQQVLEHPAARMSVTALGPLQENEP